MAGIGGRHRSRRPRAPGSRLDVGNDDGTSLIELVVGMMLMTIFLAMFTGAVAAMNRAENKTEAVSLTTSQLNQAFLALDKTVRYAAVIDKPGTVSPSGDWYVELRATYAGNESCTQLRLHQKDPVDLTSWQLQTRTWPIPIPTGFAEPLFTPLASGLIISGTPFVRIDPAGDVLNQQLKFNLSSKARSGAVTETTSTSTFTLTAADSTQASPAALICQNWGGRP